MRYPLALSLSFLSLALTTCQLSAEPLHLVHAQPTTSTDSLERVVDQLEHAGQTAWIAWTIPTNNPIALGTEDDRISYLEQDNGWGSYSSDKPRHTDDHVVLLLRVAGHTLSQFRVESPKRTLDAGNLPVVELTGITPEQSLQTLKELTTAGETDRLRDSLVFAISLHGSPATIPTLASLTTPNNPGTLREKACFWLGNSSDPEAFTTLQHLARTDADAALREKLTFDLTLSKQPAATDELIRMAHTDSNTGVRKQAQFWMAHLGGTRVASDLRDSAAADPDTEVRKSAVFALSQLPANQATPQLIHVAESNNNVEVRKQAVFWLGQSSDPDALAFLTRLLQQ